MKQVIEREYKEEVQRNALQNDTTDGFAQKCMPLTQRNSAITTAAFKQWAVDGANASLLAGQTFWRQRDGEPNVFWLGTVRSVQTSLPGPVATCWYPDATSETLHCGMVVQLIVQSLLHHMLPCKERFGFIRCKKEHDQWKLTTRDTPPVRRAAAQVRAPLVVGGRDAQIAPDLAEDQLDAITEMYV
jgi:hypothetical protein